jgi:hypothetical protein
MCVYVSSCLLSGPAKIFVLVPKLFFFLTSVPKLLSVFTTETLVTWVVDPQDATQYSFLYFRLFFFVFLLLNLYLGSYIFST